MNILPVFLPHYGCGQRCIYCNQQTITNTKDSSLEKYLHSAFAAITEPVETALYSGNILGLTPSQMERLFQYFEPYKDKIAHFRISGKPGPLHEERTQILRRHGVDVVELGIPCFNDHILGALERGHTSEDLFHTYRFLKESGFTLALQVMVGLPGETWEDIKQTALSIVELAPRFIRIYPLVVIEETPLFDLYRQGRYAPDHVDQAVDKATYIYIKAWANNIKAIKMGLIENEALKEKVAAGPIHPAFGYLVKSRAFCLAVLAKCKESGIFGAIDVWLNRKDVPTLWDRSDQTSKC